MRKIIIAVACALVYGLFSLASPEAYAQDKELTLIYTGETHGALYPCNCPVEDDGGVSRRATLINQLRKKYPDSLVLDSGNFFGGGLLDQNTQNTQLDMQRSRINLAAMGLMKYDALAISDDEFNFGEDFLKENISKARLNFVSADLKLKNVTPYIIKEVSGLRVGIIGLTNYGVKQKAAGVKFIEPRRAVETAVKELKSMGASLIILLSNLGENEDLKIIENIPEISVVIDGHNRKGKELFAKTKSAVILRPTWQGRRLNKAVLNIKGNKIDKVSVEDIRVSDKVSADPVILSILPPCFSDNDCKKEGQVGACQNAGSVNAGCFFSKAARVNLTIVTPRECSSCNPGEMVAFLKKQFPGLVISYIYYPDKKAEKLVKELKATGLPLYLLGKEVEREKSFSGLKSSLEQQGDFYMLKPQVSGLGYFLDRKLRQGQLDLFISLFDKDAFWVLNIIREFNPTLHLLAVIRGDKIDTRYGKAEVEEDLRAVCVQKYYPKGFWDYLACRAKNINSSWWEDCASGMDFEKIKSCSRGPEGQALLKKNCSLGQELKIMFGPTYLLDNREIFSSRGALPKEELKKKIKK
ncbi:MAG: hypothetical protein PHV58_04115 [Candidatus Omnitrophica bacterium]|nr:hypothetical protein [Candidatus Omnitrophota bacterium]MDD5662286.1 hypothetical protein [Candidatus Omnitrophota bacterium]